MTTGLLHAWSEGNQGAIEHLLPAAYGELHRAVRACMRRERRGHTLQTTALVNELFLRMLDSRQIEWHDRSGPALSRRKIFDQPLRVSALRSRGSG